MYCCQCFTNLINSAGEAGLAILVTHLNDELRFVLQMRAMSCSDAELCNEVKTFPDNKAMVLTQSMIVHYCPSCGKCLADLVSSDPRKFEQLVLEHEPFQDDWGV